MKYHRIIMCVSVWALALGVSVPTTFAQWTNVGVGIDYQYFRVGGTNDFFVTRMSRTNIAATIDTSIGLGKQKGALETIPNQANRYDDAITWWGGEWGARNEVVVAINGGFYDLSTYEVSGGQIQSGWYSHFFADSFSGFAWRTNRTPFIGECVTHPANKVYVKFQANGNTMPIEGINRAPAASDVVIFTPQYDNQTPSGTRTEVLVEMTKPNLTTSGSGYTSGIIRSKAQNTGSTWIPFDHIVISADGSDGTTLNSNASVGDEVRIFQELYEENEPDVQGNFACTTATGVNWANVFASINSNFHFLKNNVVRIPDAVAHPGYIGYVNLNPRTAICYNADYVFFLVVDGRSAQSKGIGCADMGYWAKNVLGATDGVNIDGGGSSIMVVNGAIKNVPSDGSPRPVCNGVQMINVQPKVQTSTFSAGQQVTATGSANVRLGPGTNYYNFSSITNGAVGTVVSHGLNGVQAKGYNWWKCNFSGTVGWVAESLLSAPPVITQQPSSTVVPTNGTANFTVVATGGGLTYRWQKNGANLNNGGHYSGATAATLTVSNADINDVATYRCVVTNTFGSVTSGNATLTLGTSCTPNALTNGDFEGGNTGGVGTGWTGYQRTPNPTTVWSVQTASPPQGAQYQQIANTSSTGGGGVRQDVTGCTVGATYHVSGWMRGNSGNAVCTVKVSPTASTSWATAVNLTPAQTTNGSTWTAFSGTVVATGTSMTIWLDGQTTGTGLNKAECFDAVTVTCEGVAAQPPTITQQPSPRSVCSGATTNFSVTATGDAPLSYQWQKNSANISDGGHYSGTATATLTISSIDSGDAANYRCVVSNPGGSMNSSQAALTVKTATTITVQPTNKVVTAGANATFSVAATGDGTITYQWQKNMANLSNGGHYSGVTTATLTITGADANDVANYRCVVTAGCGSSTSFQGALSLCAVNGLTNPSFEGGNTGGVGTGWTGYQRSPNPTTVWSIQTASPPSGGGTQYQQIANTSSTGGGGVRQNVTGCVIGATYTVAGWMRGNSASATCTVKVSPTSSTTWSTAINLNPTQTYSGSTWTAFSGTVVATGTNMTLWLDGQTGGTGLNKAECFDAITVSCTP